MSSPPSINTDDPTHASGLLATVQEALSGSHLDYTTAPVGRAVIMLAVPMVMEMAMESIFAVADVFWVAHLGADAVATVGLTESMLTIIYTAASDTDGSLWTPNTRTPRPEYACAMRFISGTYPWLIGQSGAMKNRMA